MMSGGHFQYLFAFHTYSTPLLVFSSMVVVQIQSILYRAMLEHGVFMEGAILKSNIVNPGKKCPVPYTVQEIAQVWSGMGWDGFALPNLKSVLVLDDPLLFGKKTVIEMCKLPLLE